METKEIDSVVKAYIGIGNFEQLFIKGDTGYIVLLSVGAEAILIVLARADAKLGLIFLDTKRTAEKIEELL